MEQKVSGFIFPKNAQVKQFLFYSWDEWVPEDRVLKYNETNCLKQKEVKNQHATVSKNKKGATKTKKGETPSSTSGKDSDSRASTPSKELSKEQSTPSSVASSSRSRSVKAATPVVQEPSDGGPPK